MKLRYPVIIFIVSVLCVTTPDIFYFLPKPFESLILKILFALCYICPVAMICIVIKNWVKGQEAEHQMQREIFEEQRDRAIAQEANLELNKLQREIDQNERNVAETQTLGQIERELQRQAKSSKSNIIDIATRKKP